MRRSDRELRDPGQLLEVIDACKVFRLAMVAEGRPYLVPLNFGYAYEGGQFEFYFHSALQGRKLDLLRQNPQVCFELDCGHALVPADLPCGYSYRYASVIGEGTVELVEEPARKVLYLQRLLRHQAGRDFPLREEQAASVAVGRILVHSLTGKAHR